MNYLENVDGISWECVARYVRRFPVSPESYHDSMFQVSASNCTAPGRTAQECKVWWLGSQHPKFNSRHWIEDEETRLHDIVESKRESGNVNWEEISTLLDVLLRSLLT